MTTPEHVSTFHWTPVIGERVMGSSKGPWYTATWSGVYLGVARDVDGEPCHYLADGEINGSAQRSFGHLAHDGAALTFDGSGTALIQRHYLRASYDEAVGLLDGEAVESAVILARAVAEFLGESDPTVEVLADA